MNKFKQYPHLLLIDMIENKGNKKTYVGIVESNETVLKCLNKLIMVGGEFEIVLNEKTGENALSKLSYLDCDILIADEILSDMNGIEFLKFSKEINPQLNVLFLINEYSQLFFRGAAENRAISLVNLHTDPEELLFLLKKINKVFLQN